MHTHPQSLSLCHKLSSPFRYLLAESIDDDVAGNNALIAPGRRTLRLDPADSQAHEQREAEDAGQTALQLATAATNHINLGPVRTDPPNGDAQPANSAPPCSLLSSIEKRNKGLSTFTMFLVFQVYVNSTTNRHRRAPYQSNRYFISLKKKNRSPHCSLCTHPPRVLGPTEPTPPFFFASFLRPFELRAGTTLRLRASGGYEERRRAPFLSPPRGYVHRRPAQSTPKNYLAWASTCSPTVIGLGLTTADSKENG